MAVPKHKVSRSKRDKRRTHQKAQAPGLTRCTQCGDAAITEGAPFWPLRNSLSKYVISVLF